jgi:hypothetical protein
MVPSPRAVEEAARTIQQEKAKLHDGKTPPGGAGIYK